LGRKTQRKFNAVFGKTSKTKERADQSGRDARAAMFADSPKTSSALRKRDALEKKYSQQLSKTKELAGKANRNIGLDINDEMISRRKNAKRGRGDIIEKL
jgi:hypothetical protein